MKVIRTSNYGKSGEHQGEDEYVICDNCTEVWANIIAKLLNEKAPENGRDYFLVKQDNYKLKEFNP